MERQVFKNSSTGTILFLIFIVVFTGILYNSTGSLWSFALLPFFALSFISFLKNKLVIENGNMRTEKLIRSKEISLVEVSQIIIGQEDTTDSDGDRSTKTYMNVLDKAGHSIFTFPYEYINSTKDRERFIGAVLAGNPAIEMDFETDFAKMKAAIQEYRKNKKLEKRKVHNDSNL